MLHTPTDMLAAYSCAFVVYICSIQLQYNSSNDNATYCLFSDSDVMPNKLTW